MARKELVKRPETMFRQKEHCIFHTSTWQAVA